MLIVRHAGTDGSYGTYRAYDADGNSMEEQLVPFERSVAATALSFGEPCVMNDLAAAATLEPQPFERGRSSLLAALPTREALLPHSLLAHPACNWAQRTCSAPRLRCLLCTAGRSKTRRTTGRP